MSGTTACYLVMNPTLWLGVSARGGYQCSRNAYDCRDFRTRPEAQAAYWACGGLGNDVHRLDQDRDGLACERLP
jgi:hypothetical protein